jgi:hypothetical protein
MLINFDTSRLYFHSELPWSANHPGGPTGGGEAVVKWLEAMARTPQEKAEVAQEFAQDQTDPTHMLGNGINENSLYGWALMGVDPFDPYGPDGGLQGVINQLKTGSTGSVATKDAEKQAKKAEQKSDLINQVTPGSNPVSTTPVKSGESSAKTTGQDGDGGFLRQSVLLVQFDVLKRAFSQEENWAPNSDAKHTPLSFKV